MIRQRVANLLRTCIRESEKADYVDGWIGEDGIRGVVDSGSRNLSVGWCERGRTDVINRRAFL